MKKDVQRTFILLRPCSGGRESGYARAEVRDGNIRLNLAVQGFNVQQQHYAFAVTREGILLIGPVQLDARGQGGAAVQLGAEDLRAMQVLCVGCVRGSDVEILLAGTVGRGGWVDWTQVRTLAADALLPKAAIREDAEEVTVQAPVPEEAVEEKSQEDLLNLEAETQTAASESAKTAVDLYDLPAQEDPFEAVERELRTPLSEEKRLEMPDALQQAYWPQLLWPLHDLFERFEAVQPFVGQEDTVYIRIPLGEKLGGVDHYLVGARVEDGWVTGVGYLIPGAAASAPDGFDGYVWKDGYWQSWQNVEKE